MTTITIDRATVEQALEALEKYRKMMFVEAGCRFGEGDAAITALRAALAQQDEPLNLSDRAVQRRLATQWGYVPAAQAEPVEPVAWLQPKTVDAHTRPDLGYETCSKTDYGAFSVYTAPPQRKPLPKHDQHCVDVPGYGLMAVRLVRAVERAHGIKE